MADVFQPLQINSMLLPNRFIRSATYEGLATPKGMVTDELVNLYSELGGGGLGLIVAGYASIQANGVGGPGCLAFGRTIILKG